MDDLMICYIIVIIKNTHIIFVLKSIFRKYLVSIYVKTGELECWIQNKKKILHKTF
jgi:hypothetical protein